jgi:regulatory protein
VLQVAAQLETATFMPYEPNDMEMARIVAYRYLGVSARSQKEIERRLERAGFLPEIIEAVVTELTAQNWLNDEQFAQDWVADRADRKRYGKRRLQQELTGKGVEKDTIVETLQAVNEDDELRRALEAARSKTRSLDMNALSADEWAAEKRRLMGFLQRRGFSFSTIKEVFAALKANTDELE